MLTKGDLTLHALQTSSPKQPNFKAVCHAWLKEKFPSTGEEDLAIFLKKFCAKSKAKWQAVGNHKNRYLEKYPQTISSKMKLSSPHQNQKKFLLQRQSLLRQPKMCGLKSMMPVLGFQTHYLLLHQFLLRHSILSLSNQIPVSPYILTARQNYPPTSKLPLLHQKLLQNGRLPFRACPGSLRNLHPSRN